MDLTDPSFWTYKRILLDDGQFVNPMTYASEGLRYAMVPAVHGYTLPTLSMGWVVPGLSVTFVAFLILGIRTFKSRVVN